MIHDQILQEIKQDRQRGQFIYPYYGKYSIAEVEPSIRMLFGLPSARNRLPDRFFKKQNYKKVVLFVVDGLGYQDMLRYGRGTIFFDRLMDRGEVLALTSTFPSTTPAALTTLHTGFTPQEHGLPEWFTYFREFQKVIMPMQFRSSWEDEHNILLKQGGHPGMLYENFTIYETLRQAGIQPVVFVYHEYLPSAYSDAVQKGARIIPYREGFDLMARLRQELEVESGPSFYHVYWGQVDRLGHQSGPGSREHRYSISAFSDLIDGGILQKLRREVAEDVLVVLCADHGQIGIAERDIIYLNDYPTAVDNFQSNDIGEPILPTGSPNDVFLFIKEDRLAEVVRQLQQDLQGIAEVMTQSEALTQGLYGLGEPLQRFLDRIGNVVIIPYPHKHIWYTKSEVRRYGQLGIHGGLSEEEMIVPFAVASLADLL
jgi:predicted AlkP superfamily pyrophosphatase or phosphodiesterase